MKIGDLIKIDWVEWIASTEIMESLHDVIVYGVIVDMYIGGAPRNREYIIVYTMDGEYKTFTTEKDLPPTITVISTGNH